MQLNSVLFLRGQIITSYPQQFSLTAPDSLGAIEYFGFCNLIYMPPVISGGYFAGGSSIDSFGLTFEATLTSVPAENVMNDEYYFAAGPGKTKVFVVESIGGYPLDKLPAEWGDVYPVILDVKHYEGTNAYFRGQIYFTTLGWLEIPNIFSYDGDFWIEYPDSLGTRCLYFLELQYNPPVLSGIFWPLSNSVPNPSKKYSFISRRMTMPNDDLPKEEFK